MVIKKYIMESLDIPENRLELYIKKSDKFYKKVLVPKKRGGYREIYVPNPEIKLIQHFIKENYFERINLFNNSFAYQKGKSISMNANLHIGNKSFLQIDITNFFDSINYNKMVDILATKMDEVDVDDIKDILKICSFNHKFVQGAVTSPIISNIYLYEFDNYVSNYVSKKLNGVYSRYSDDIIISSPTSIPSEIIEIVAEELKKLDLTINKEKTHFCSNLQKIEITGLKISKNEVGLSTKKKRKLKNMIYHKLHDNKSDETARQVLGHLNYLMSVEPLYFNRLNMKYGDKKKTLKDRLVEMMKSEEREVIN